MIGIKLLQDERQINYRKIPAWRSDLAGVCKVSDELAAILNMIRNPSERVPVSCRGFAGVAAFVKTQIK